MCVYSISEAPYLAVSNVYKIKNRNCLIEDTKGRIRIVDPLYVGPFDSEKILKFGALISRYFQHPTIDTVEKSHELFGLKFAES